MMVHIVSSVREGQCPYTDGEVGRVRYMLSGGFVSQAVVVILHGLGSNSMTSTMVASLQSDLNEAGIPSVAPCLPCHEDFISESDTFTLSRARSAVSSVIDRITTYVRKDIPIHVAGNSMGGYLALLAKQDHPDVVRSATILSGVYDYKALVLHHLALHGGTVQRWRDAGEFIFQIPDVGSCVFPYSFYEELESGALGIANTSRDGIRALHGTGDMLVPVNQARDFFRETPENLDLFSADHGFSDSPEQIEYSRAFLRSHVIDAIQG